MSTHMRKDEKIREAAMALLSQVDALLAQTEMYEQTDIDVDVVKSLRSALALPEDEARNNKGGSDE